MTPPRIVMAEDEELIAAPLSAILENQGYQVTRAQNGRQALEAIAEGPPDLLLTDMRMPVMDGGELIRNIRLDHPRLPILVMTGYSERVPPEEPGRLLVLQKPFAPAQLVSAIRSLLSGSPSLRPPASTESICRN